MDLTHPLRPTPALGHGRSAALLALGAVLLASAAMAPSASARPAARGADGHAVATTRLNQAVEQPAGAVLSVLPRHGLVRAARHFARTSARWLAIVLWALAGAALARRGASRADRPFVGTVALRDIVRRRGPPILTAS